MTKKSNEILKVNKISAESWILTERHREKQNFKERTKSNVKKIIKNKVC